jgi:hypothetical protein
MEYIKVIVLHSSLSHTSSQYELRVKTTTLKGTCFMGFSTWTRNGAIYKLNHMQFIIVLQVTAILFSNPYSRTVRYCATFASFSRCRYIISWSNIVFFKRFKNQRVLTFAFFQLIISSIQIYQIRGEGSSWRMRLEQDIRRHFVPLWNNIFL